MQSTHVRTSTSTGVPCCDSRHLCPAKHAAATLPRPTPLYCLRSIFYWRHNSATAPNVYTAAPRPTSPLSLPLHCTRCPMPLSPLRSTSPAFLSLPALHTIHATPSSIRNSRFFNRAHCSSMIIKASSGRQSVPMRCIPYTLRQA